MTPFPGTPIHEMALRGEGGYRLLSGGWEDFDKYSSGVLELENVSLGQLKRYQLRCYANLYLRNRRFRDLAAGRGESRRRLGDAALGRCPHGAGDGSAASLLPNEPSNAPSDRRQAEAARRRTSHLARR